jgi:hypothetical protein
LLGCLAANDAHGVHKAIFRLGAVHHGFGHIPDDIVERLSMLLQREPMYKSRLAAHILISWNLNHRIFLRTKTLWIDREGHDFSRAERFQNVPASAAEGNP